MITLCPGWITPHRTPLLLQPEDGGKPGVSHGMCPACERALAAELAAEDAAALGGTTPAADPLYAEYAANFPFVDDPRR